MKYSKSHWVSVFVMISLMVGGVEYYNWANFSPVIPCHKRLHKQIQALSSAIGEQVTLVPMITPLFKSLFFKSPNLSKKLFTSSASTSTSTLINSRPFTSRLTAHLLCNPNGSGKRLVGYWLAGCSAAVFGIIVFGGLTRLTESGLSMVDWKLVHFKAPQTPAEWEAYFALYQQYPEYKL